MLARRTLRTLQVSPMGARRVTARSSATQTPAARRGVERGEPDSINSLGVAWEIPPHSAASQDTHVIYGLIAESISCRHNARARTSLIAPWSAELP